MCFRLMAKTRSNRQVVSAPNPKKATKSLSPEKPKKAPSRSRSQSPSRATSSSSSRQQSQSPGRPKAGGRSRSKSQARETSKSSRSSSQERKSNTKKTQDSQVTRRVKQAPNAVGETVVTKTTSSESTVETTTHRYPKRILTDSKKVRLL